MGKTKKYIFIQESLLAELEETGNGSVNSDNQLVLSNGKIYQLSSAVKFIEEVTGAGDQKQLVPLVLTFEELEERGYEFSVDSVIVDELVYLVQEGFKGALLDSNHQKKQIIKPEEKTEEQMLGNYILNQLK